MYYEIKILVRVKDDAEANATFDAIHDAACTCFTVGDGPMTAQWQTPRGGCRATVASMARCTCGYGRHGKGRDPRCLAHATPRMHRKMLAEASAARS